jgi:hypothetical protein
MTKMISNLFQGKARCKEMAGAGMTQTMGAAMGQDHTKSTQA